MNELASKVMNCFRENFSSAPQLYFSPGRINMIGEHVDYNDGFVMPAAIDKGVYYAVATNNSETISFYAIDPAEKFSTGINDIKKNTGWKNYVLGVVNEFLLLGKGIKGFDCAFSGDVPQGSGMSSSAAMEGGLAFALNDILNFGLNRKDLALLCQRAEHSFPGVKCGIMDMYASLNGKKDHVLLLDCMNISHEYFPLKLDGYKIVLLNSKVHHSLAGGEYNDRRKSCEDGLAILKEYLKISSFRDIENVAQVEPYKKMMGPVVYDCCVFVTEEIARTKKAASLLKQNELPGFGKLMFQTHAGLSRLYKVSCPELDLLVELAAANQNVIGARLMGGGFGGCTINIVKEDAVDGFVDEIAKVYKSSFGISLEPYFVKIADGTGRIFS